MKNFLIIVLICASFGLAGCRPEQSGKTAVKRIGVGFVQEDQGRYFVEIDSVQYPVTSIVVSNFNKISPVDGMEVTCCGKDGKFIFITGNQSEEICQEYVYTGLWTYYVILGELLFIIVFIVFVLQDVIRFS